MIGWAGDTPLAGLLLALAAALGTIQETDPDSMAVEVEAAPQAQPEAAVSQIEPSP
jgi:hypothetical protein